MTRNETGVIVTLSAGERGLGVAVARGEDFVGFTHLLPFDDAPYGEPVVCAVEQWLVGTHGVDLDKADAILVDVPNGSTLVEAIAELRAIHGARVVLVPSLTWRIPDPLTPWFKERLLESAWMPRSDQARASVLNAVALSSWWWKQTNAEVTCER